MYSYTELQSRFNRSSNPNKTTFNLENNTIVIKECIGQYNIKLHNSIIANIMQDCIILYSDGWRTPTTKDRLNKVLSDNKTHYTIWQTNHMWFVHPDYLLSDDKYKFVDGITFQYINDNWQVFNFAQDNTREINQLKNKITKYVNSFYDKFASGKLDQPSNGDCFYCLMHTVDDNIPLGDKIHDREHLLLHIEESYYVPSLLANAVLYTPHSKMAEYLMYAWINKTDDFKWLLGTVGHQIKKSLYRYMIDKLIKSE